MKAIQFQKNASKKIYADYIKRIKRTTSKLTYEDRQDILMEFNSHIFEAIQHKTEGSEIDRLLNVLETLGAPEEVLQPLIAEKTLQQATRTFNPITVARAVVLNIANGFSYIFFAILYLFLFIFIYTIFAKIAWPDQVGMFFQNGHFELLGSMNPEDRKHYKYVDVLGAWFIPVMILISLAWYFLITLLLKIKSNFTK